MTGLPSSAPALFDTTLTRLFGIRHPILCGGLLWLSTARYVAAVVKAGGMGFITARTFRDDLDAFRDDLRLCRTLTGGLPFGVNLHISARPAENAILDAYVSVLLAEGVRHVETSGGSPAALLPALKAAGCVVIHKVSTVRHGISAAKAGVDAVSVVGQECGGHPGMDLIGTMVQGALAPRRLPVPVVIGGGIGTGRQMVAALAMGAAGVLLGTRMLAAAEIVAHPDYKAQVVAADETGTRLILGALRNTYRVLDNPAARAVAALEAAGETDIAAYMPIIQGGNQKAAYASGATDGATLSMGQALAFTDRVAPVAEILAGLLDDARAALNHLSAITQASPVAGDAP